MNGYNFTERLRTVVTLAREEAVRLNHEYIGTEHLLLGLIREGEGVGVAALKKLNVNLDAIRRSIEDIVKVGKSENVVGVELPFTSRAKKVMELAMNEARTLGEENVGTQHLASGLLQEGRGIAAQVLTDAGANEGALRGEIHRLLGKPTGAPATTATTTAVAKDFVGPSWPPELDAVVAAPAQHRVLLENPRVRVLDTLIAPGERTPVHTHRWPAVHYVMSWSEFIRRDPDDNILLDTRGSKSAGANPYALWGDPLPPHSLENVGTAPLHIVSVELKR